MTKNNRLFLLSWIVVPLLLVWISTNYLLGLGKNIAWQNNSAVSDVQGSTVQEVKSVYAEPLRWNGNGLITLWFDDAWQNQFSAGLPIMEKYSLKGALAVPTGFVNFDAYMGWSQIKLLQTKGWEITSHSRSHSCNASDLTPDFMESEFHGSQDDLLKEGISSNEFVSPCGVDLPQIKEVVKKYYLALRTTDDGLNKLPLDDPYTLKARVIRWQTTSDDVAAWIKEAADEHSWLIIVFHQIQNEKDTYAIDPEKFDRVVSMVKNSGLQVVLPIQVIQLITRN